MKNRYTVKHKNPFPLLAKLYCLTEQRLKTMNKSVHPTARNFRWTDDDEPFSSISSFHHIRFTDKIQALRVINDLQSKTLEDYLKKLKEKNALEVSRLEGKDKSAYDDYTDYISLYAVWEKISNEIQRPTDRDAITVREYSEP